MPSPSVEATRNSMAPGLRYAVTYHAPRGPSAMLCYGRLASNVVGHIFPSLCPRSI